MKTTVKVSITILSLLVVFVCLTLFAPFIRNSNNVNDNYDNVMSEANINNSTKIIDIAMLGAHDAFSKDISVNSLPNVNEGGIVNNNLVNKVAKALVVKMSKAQIASTKEMLYAGVRYFDCRVTKIDNVYYTFHGYLSNTLSSYLYEMVEFLDTHKGEVIIFDIQHFYGKNDKDNYHLEKSYYEDLLKEINSVKFNNKSLLDYVYYTTDTNISELTYGMITKNKTTSGVVMLAKTNDIDILYARDGDASMDNPNNINCRSYWHNRNSDSDMLEGMEKEYNYIIDNNIDNCLVINQAQKTGFIMNSNIVRSLFNWSLIGLANNFNAVLVKDKDRFIKYLDAMPILMVDYATSNKGSFNKLANEYIKEYNGGL